MAGMVTLLIVLGLALYVCWLMLQPFFNVLLWAVVLTVVFYPMHRRIRYKTGRPSLAAAISTLLVVLLIVLPVTFVTIAVVRELTGAAANLRRGVQWLTDPNVPFIGWLLEKARNYVDIDRDSASDIPRQPHADLGRVSRAQHARRGRRRGRCGRADGAGRVHDVLPVPRRRAAPRRGLRDAAARARPDRIRSPVARADVIAATLYGVLVISAIQGTLGTFIFWALGLPSPLLWGVVMFFLSMIPMAGSFLVWVPAAIVLALSGAYVKAGVLVCLGHPRHRIDRQLSVAAAGRQARPAARVADLLFSARRAAGIRRARSRPRARRRRDHTCADRNGSGGAHADSKTPTGGGEEGGTNREEHRKVKILDPPSSLPLVMVLLAVEVVHPRQNSFPSCEPITIFPEATAGDADSGPPASNSNRLLPLALSRTYSLPSFDPT